MNFSQAEISNWRDCDTFFAPSMPCGEFQQDRLPRCACVYFYSGEVTHPILSHKNLWAFKKQASKETGNRLNVLTVQTCQNSAGLQNTSRLSHDVHMHPRACASVASPYAHPARNYAGVRPAAQELALWRLMGGWHFDARRKESFYILLPSSLTLFAGRFGERRSKVDAA